MKKEYLSPDFEVLSVELKDVLYVSVTEPTLPEIIGGGDEDETQF